jgi:hypothetical protein
VFFLVEGGVLLGKLWRNSALKRAVREAKAAEARGEKIDAEAIAGGLAMDLEEKLKKFAGGGARQFARELMDGIKGFKEGVREAGGFDAASLFDDDFKDDAPPPAEVKLKTQPRKKREVTPTPAASPEVKAPEAATAQPELPAAEVKRERDDFAAIPGAERIPADIALYVDNRIACRLDEMFEERIKPYLEKAIEAAKHNGNGHSKEPSP